MLNANPAAATWLMKGIGELRGAKLEALLPESERPILKGFLIRLFNATGLNHCALRLLRGDSTEQMVELVGTLSSDRTEVWVTVIDKCAFIETGAEGIHAGLKESGPESGSGTTSPKSGDTGTGSSERFIRLIIENIPGLIAYWSKDLVCELASREYLEWFGYSAEAMKGLSMQEVLGEELFLRNKPYIEGVLAGEVQRFEREIRNGAGEFRSAWCQYVPVMIEKQSRGFLVLITDISLFKRTQLALEEANSHLQNIFDTMQSGLVVADLHGRITQCNHAAERVLGLPNDQIVGRTSLDSNWHCVEEDGRPFSGERHPAMEVIRTGKPVFDKIMGLKQDDGSIVWITVNASPLTGTGGVEGSITIFSDITSLKESEERYRKAKDAAEAASRAKSQFLATMGHELRTPMNGLLGFGRLLLDTNLTAEQSEFLETLIHSGESLLTLLNDILDYSKIQAGTLQVETLPVDLRVTITEVMELIAHRVRNKGLKLSVNYPDSVPSQAIGEPDRVRQVILNLVGNALKFTHHGEISIRAELEPSQDLRISIIDTGIGIPVDQQALLFQPFSQIDSSSTRKFDGAGLGLAIARRFVELMGGKIGVISDQGKGSTFWFTLPLQPLDTGEMEIT